jgi:hypothetical protein
MDTQRALWLRRSMALTRLYRYHAQVVPSLRCEVGPEASDRPIGEVPDLQAD